MSAITVRPLVTALPAPPTEAIDKTPPRLSSVDPGSHPDIKSELLNRAMLLLQAAQLRDGTDPQDREQAAVLSEWARSLHQEKFVSDNDLNSLAMSLDLLPERMQQTAGHLGACATAREELRQLENALDDPGSNAQISLLARGRFQGDMRSAGKLLDQALASIEADQLEALPELGRQVRGKITGLRDSLRRAGVAVPSDAPAQASPRAQGPGLAVRGPGTLSRIAQKARELFLKVGRSTPQDAAALDTRAEMARRQLIAAQQKFGALELKLAELASNGSESDRIWVLNTQHTGLRQRRARLDAACSHFKPDATGCRNAEHTVKEVRRFMAAIDWKLDHPSLR